MKKFLNEFKEFAFRGSVIDLAVGVLIGAAFQGVVTSFTENIISPILGLFTRTDLSGWSISIFRADIRYGAFMTSIINFVIMAFVIFLMVTAINKLRSLGKKKELPTPETTKVCPFCRSTIDIKATRCPHCTSVLDEDLLK